MKRCGVFVIYNEDEVIEKYVEYLLGHIQNMIDELYVVINGSINNAGLEIIRNYTENIYIRDNFGYDGGAYKYFFTKADIRKRLERFDEVVMFNDTFFGPFYSLDSIFEDMSDKHYDFWGLTQHYGGMDNYWKVNIPPHVQSYFIVLRKKVIIDNKFYEFWENMQYIANFQEAVFTFEIAFSDYLVNLGFRFGAWVDIKERCEHLLAPDQLLLEKKSPFLKRKFFTVANYCANKRVLEFLDREYGYDKQIVLEDIKLRCKNNRMVPFNALEILEKCRDRETIYIYGDGVYSYNIIEFLKDNGITNIQIVVSDESDDNKKIVFNNVTLTTNDFMIVALSKNSFQEVIQSVREKVKEEQLVVPLF